MSKDILPNFHAPWCQHTIVNFLKLCGLKPWKIIEPLLALHLPNSKIISQDFKAKFEKKYVLTFYTLTSFLSSQHFLGLPFPFQYYFRLHFGTCFLSPHVISVRANHGLFLRKEKVLEAALWGKWTRKTGWVPCYRTPWRLQLYLEQFFPRVEPTFLQHRSPNM